MTNEIKEILDYVFSLAYGECFSDEREDIKKAEDYITNLQEKYKEADKSYTKTIYKYNKVLSRNEKAIQYINKCEYQRYCPSPYEKEKYIMREEKEGQDLLNILRGDE